VKVTSPVGDFPFRATRVRRDGASIVIEGAMGAWPASVQVGVSDAPMLLRLASPAIWWSVGVLAAALAAHLAAGRR
jgi:hypothetical protein